MDSDLRNIILGLASAVIFAAIARAGDLIRRQHQRVSAARRYPIGGEYVSTYSDVIGGKIRVVRDQVHIQQRGLTFKGYSTNLSSGRRFNLEGRIVDHRYLAGTYSGDHRADQSSGVFYLALDLLNDGCVKGVWAGYGAESQAVISGEWNWQKMADVKIIDCEPGHRTLGAAASLLNDSLGSGFIRPEDLQLLAASDEGVVLAAVDEAGHLQGVGTAYVLDHPEKEELEAKLAAAGARRPNLIGARVGILKSSAVLPAVRGRGVGFQLVTERLARLAALGCSKVVVLAWDSGSDQSSIGVLEAAGFDRVADLPEYWREPAGQETFDCIRCGRPCTCTAVVMSRGLYDYGAEDSQRKIRRSVGS